MADFVRKYSCTDISERQIEAELDEEGNLVNADEKDHLNEDSDNGNDDDDDVPVVITKTTEAGGKRGMN